MPGAARAAILAHMQDLEFADAQDALLARFAPDTQVRRIRWSGGGTQVYELGSGPPLLYVHGGLAGAFEIVPVLGALAERHRVLAVDRPGHGLADPFEYRGVDMLAHASAFLGEVLDALELPAVDVLANSMGALWSAALALSAPHRITRFAMLGAPAGIRRQVPLPLFALGTPFAGRLIGRHVFTKGTRDGSRRFWGRILVARPDRVDDLVLDMDVANGHRNVESLLGLIGCVDDFRRLGLRRELVLGERWGALTMPTLLVWGDRDVFASPADAEALAAQSPRIRLVRLPDAGHLPWFDEPERVVAEVVRFSAPSRHPAGA
jgi:pimeloyl-ACP methyl ester carboxylesterase